MFGGRQVFMSMKMPESISLGGGQDTVDMYLMATTSHDGTKAFTAAVTPVRPVCSNTVRLALGSAVSHWSLRHTTNVQGQIALAREALGVVWSYQKDFSEAAGRLASAGFSEDNFDVFLLSLIKEDAENTDRQEKKAESIRSEMRALWNAPTQANIAGTRWAAYNAVVEWADWVKPVRSKDTDKDAVRAARIMSGGVSDLKDRAYRLLAV
jgi:phage/plasmid-like protein (TIGR03299 family)